MTPDPNLPASRNPRPLAPKTSDFQRTSEEDGIKRKQPKSRNGCLTCKAKRMKCDEAKPSCQQCVRRGLTCGGYRKDLKWKAFGQPKGASASASSSRGRAHEASAERADDTLLSGGSPASEDVTNGIGGLSGDAIAIPAVPSLDPAEQSSICLPHPAHSTTTPHQASLGTQNDQHSGGPWRLSPNAYWLDTDMLFSGFNDDHGLGDRASTLSDLAFLDPQMSNDTQDHFDWRPYGFDTFEELLDRTKPAPLLPQVDIPTATGRTPDSQQEFDMSSGPLWRPAPRITAVNEGDWFSLFQQSQFKTASPEMISLVFHQYTCRILSIDDEEEMNPWRLHVWPLAKDYPALYHAIAAMTCFHLSRAQPQLRTQAIGHVQCSMETLATNVDNGTISLDAALAASLALAWAESWDGQRASTGKSHIDGARTLVKQARTSQNRSPLLNFLINDFLYMDVIARLTSTFDDMSLSTPISYPLDQASNETQFDSLMGYAYTLFPVLGAVADLIGCIRARSAKRNSPAIISRATELKKAIERWGPSIDLEEIDDPSSTMADSIQTAEAYRWAALLLLQQAVPELPNKAGYRQLAQKVLVFLATVPLSSTTMIIQHFPLMMAGCEAVEEEDRDWVRDRWASMGKKLVTGIIDKCLQVNTEVWKRRDDYAAHWGLCPLSGVKRSPQLSAISADANSGRRMDLDQLDFGLDFFDPQALDRSPTDIHQRPSSKAARSASPDFPISAAFRKGVDHLTRSGCVDFTVRGKLHWLGVMKDFGWEIMLG